MKRVLISVMIAVSLLLSGISCVGAAPLIQETDGGDLIDAVQIFADLISGLVDAAGEEIAKGDESEIRAEPTAAPTDTAMPEPTATATFTPTFTPTATATFTPTATATFTPTFTPTATATYTPTATETPLPTATEPAFRSAPADPEGVSVSTGIEVSDFFTTYKANVKSTGRHSVAFEEKARKNASRIEVDDDVEVLLYYSKSGRKNLIDRIVFEKKSADSKAEANAKTMLSVLIRTLCGYLDQPFNEADYEEICQFLDRGESVIYGDLLIYGSGSGNKMTVRIYYTGAGYVEPPSTTYSKSAEDEFRDLIADFKARNVIPNRDGAFRFHEDYESEWAQINWYQWDTFDTAKNFVVSADITWKSASNTPNYQFSGCGFVFRGVDSDNNLYAAVNMDGKVHFGGYRYGRQLSYAEGKYGPVSTKGSAQMVLVVNENTATIYIDGSRVAQQKVLGVTEEGGLAFTVFSGTNKDYGTRCTFRNIYYYIW